MRIVVALGGNALGGGETPAQERDRRLAVTASQLADLIQAGHQIVVTHGNGPQVGELVLDQEARRGDGRGEAMPLDVLVAMTQAELGYRLQRALGRELAGRGRNAPVVALVTQVLVDRKDPAFSSPTKPVGPGYVTRPTDGKEYTLTRGDRWRRVVPSPTPHGIVERDALRAIIEDHIVPVCAGGGGIPVVEEDDGSYRGVEAVIDKDLTSALVARDVDADGLLILTDVDRVVRHHGTPDAEPLDRLAVAEARAMVADGDAASGSMGPKLEAACQVAEAGGLAVIGPLGAAVESLDGKTGTRVVADAATSERAS